MPDFREAACNRLKPLPLTLRRRVWPGAGILSACPALPAERLCRHRGWLLSLGVCVLGLGSGCLYLPSKSGTGRVLVVGIGLVSIHDRTNAPLTATSTQVLGLEVSDRPGLKVGVGYASSVVTTASDGAEDVRAEVSRWPFGPVKIQVDRATLAAPTNSASPTQDTSPPKPNTP